MTDLAARRVVISGMAINVPIGDTLDTYYDNLVAGKSAVTKWKFIDTSGIYSKVGGDLSEYDIQGKLADTLERLPQEMRKRTRKLVRKAPFSTQLTILCAADAWCDARLDTADLPPERVGVIVGGHNLANNLVFTNNVQFQEEPEYIHSMLALHGLDTDQASSVGEALGFRGSVYTMGGACASTNIALRNAVDEIRYHDHDIMFVAGAPLDFSPVDLQAMAIMGAISYESFNDEPERASRPYDQAREGFIPSHGAGVLVVEELDHAKRRDAPIYAELLGVATASDGSHLPAPSVEGQVRTMRRLLDKTGVAPEEVDYINAHATSTHVGDLTEVQSIKELFGKHAYEHKVNATKTMLGHTCWSAPATETVASILQMNRGTLHPTINIDNIDPEVDIDICANRAVDHEINVMMKNSFGFGGINCCALYRRYND
jgi:3-oxoacyl-(acyl-carrier-protein) synthase